MGSTPRRNPRRPRPPATDVNTGATDNRTLRGLGAVRLALIVNGLMVAVKVTAGLLAIPIQNDAVPPD